MPEARTPTPADAPVAEQADGLQIYSVEAASGIRATLKDLREGLQLGEVWRTFAWDEIQSRYRRSTLGLAWIAISYLLFVFAIAFFFGGFSRKEGAEFVHYVAVGYATFAYLIGNLSEGCSVFRSSASWIHSSAMPYSVYVYKRTARSLFPFAIQITLAVALMIATGWRPEPVVLMVVPAFAAILITAIGVQLTLGYLGARFNDLQHLIGSVQRLLLFLTPILWVFEERQGIVRKVAMFNPLTHYLEVFRAPLLGDMPMAVSIYAVLGLTVGVCVLGVFVSSRMRAHLPFWI